MISGAIYRKVKDKKTILGWNEIHLFERRISSTEAREFTVVEGQEGEPVANDVDEFVITTSYPGVAHKLGKATVTFNKYEWVAFVDGEPCLIALEEEELVEELMGPAYEFVGLSQDFAKK